MITTTTTENFSVAPLPEAEVARALRGKTQPRRDVGGIVLNVMFGIVREGFPATADLAAAGDWDYQVTGPDERREQWHAEMAREIKAAVVEAGCDPRDPAVGAEIDEWYSIGEHELEAAEQLESMRLMLGELEEEAQQGAGVPPAAHDPFVRYAREVRETWEDRQEAWAAIYDPDPGLRLREARAPRRLAPGCSRALDASIWRPTGRAPRLRTNHRSSRAASRGDPDELGDEPPSRRRLPVGRRR